MATSPVFRVKLFNPMETVLRPTVVLSRPIDTPSYVFTLFPMAIPLGRITSELEPIHMASGAKFDTELLNPAMKLLAPRLIFDTPSVIDPTSSDSFPAPIATASESLAILLLPAVKAKAPELRLFSPKETE